MAITQDTIETESTTHLRNTSLARLVTLLKHEQNERADYIVPAGRMTSRNGLITFPTNEHNMVRVTPMPTMLGTMAPRLDIPIKFLRDIYGKGMNVADDPTSALAHMQAFDAVTNARLSQAAANDRKFMVRSFGKYDSAISRGRAFLSNSYQAFDNLDVLMAILEGFNESGIKTEVTGADLSDHRMRVRIKAPAITYVATEFLKGYTSPYGVTGEDEPLIAAGIEISNSETGHGAFTLAFRAEVLACKNGMRSTIDLMRKTHLGTRLETGHINWAADTQTANRDLIVKEARDRANMFLNNDYLETTIRALEENANTQLTNPTATIKHIAHKLQWTETETNDILNRYITRGNGTAGAVLQATTEHAQTTPNPDRAAQIETQATQIPHLAATHQQTNA